MASEYIRNDRIEIRISEKELRWLDELCKLYEMNRSDFIRGLLRQHYFYAHNNDPK